MKFLRILFVLLRRCGQRIKMHSYKINFCDGCDNKRKNICEGEGILPSMHFIDYEKLRKAYNKSERFSCDLVYDDKKKLVYIENKHIFYFVQFLNDKNTRSVENILCNVIKNKIDHTLELYESLFPPNHSNRSFILFFSKKVSFPIQGSTIQKNQAIAKMEPSFLKFFLITSISAIENFRGMRYTHPSGVIIRVYVDECTNASVHFY